ncbi:hypothetical protein JOD97_002596 [Duganella sp. 1411]|nr:hypothetical protein [Duganella sp. 1411]
MTAGGWATGKRRAFIVKRRWSALKAHFFQ